jgi:hypothetical protein
MPSISSNAARPSSRKVVRMFSKGIAFRKVALTVLFFSVTLFSQQTPPPPSPSAGTEFPVIMRQNVTAGKTPVGAKVEASLVVATLVNGVVIPRDAVLSGEVIQSVAKSPANASRLALRMDSVQWKNGSASIKLYLTPWFYPVSEMAPQNLSYEPPDAANSPKNWNGAGTYPDPNNPASQPFPGRDIGRDTSNAPLSPASNISKHRVLMKNVESTRDSDGAVALTSKRSNIKLDKLPTYVLAISDLLTLN